MSECALFGKIPQRGDFVALGRREEAERELEQWLATAVEQSQGLRGSHPVRFFAPRLRGPSLVGVWVESRDEVGREFPLVISCRISEEVEQLAWSVVPAFHAESLAEAVRVLEASERGLDWLSVSLRKLPEPHLSVLPGWLQQTKHQLAHERVSELCQRLFVVGGTDSLAYALHTLERAAALAVDGPTLEVPLTSERDLFVWLELLRAQLGGSVRPSLVLWSVETRRALIALGPASPLLIAWFFQTRSRSHRRWPVWTEQLDAIRTAGEALSPQVRELLARDATLGELLASWRRGEGA